MTTIPYPLPKLPASAAEVGSFGHERSTTWSRVTVQLLLAFGLIVACSGCRTAAQTVTSCCGSFWSPASVATEPPVNVLLPPEPAPENLKLGMSAHPPMQPGLNVPQPRLLDPSSLSAGSHNVAVATAPPLAPPTAGLGPEPVTAPPSAPPPSTDPAIEQRLAALETECRQKLTALETLESQYATQNQELVHVREQLASSKSDVATLTELVGTLQQRDVASLEQLSQTLDSLLEPHPVPAPATAEEHP